MSVIAAMVLGLAVLVQPQQSSANAPDFTIAGFLKMGSKFQILYVKTSVSIIREVASRNSKKDTQVACIDEWFFDNSGNTTSTIVSNMKKADQSKQAAEFMLYLAQNACGSFEY